MLALICSCTQHLQVGNLIRAPSAVHVRPDAHPLFDDIRISSCTMHYVSNVFVCFSIFLQFPVQVQRILQGVPAAWTQGDLSRCVSPDPVRLWCAIWEPSLLHCFVGHNALSAASSGLCLQGRTQALPLKAVGSTSRDIADVVAGSRWHCLRRRQHADMHWRAELCQQLTTGARISAELGMRGLVHFVANGLEHGCTAAVTRV